MEQIPRMFSFYVYMIKIIIGMSCNFNGLADNTIIGKLFLQI